MSWKDEYIRLHGEEKYIKHLIQAREWRMRNPEKVRQQTKKWRADNPEKAIEQQRIWRMTNPKKSTEYTKKWQAKNRKKVIEIGRGHHRKGGKFYKEKLVYNKTGLQGKRQQVRLKHGNQWRSYKRIFAPGSVLHHQWLPDTANYAGVALVEKDQHIHGFIDVIKILEGVITLYTEKEIRKGRRN